MPSHPPPVALCYTTDIVPDRPATYEDLLRLEEDVRAEVLAGVVCMSPAPLPEHARVQRALGSYIGGPFDDDDGHGGPGGWWIYPEVDIALGDHDIVRPDLTGYRRERLPEPMGQRPFKLAPDWVCEIQSPSTAARDRVTKRNLYAKSGIHHYWLIDPAARTLEALELRPEGWFEVGVYDETAIVRIKPFEPVELAVGRLFHPRGADERGSTGLAGQSG